MNALTLRQSSCDANDQCVVYCQSMANLLLENATNSSLLRLTTEDGNVHFVWSDLSIKTEFPEFVPVFQGSGDDDICDIKEIHEIADGEVFCFNGWVYCLHKMNNGKTIIRSVRTLWSQKVVEDMAFYDFDASPIKEIYMVNFYDIENGKKYCTTCWVKMLENNMIEYLPVFDEDEYYFMDRDVTSYLKEEVFVGGRFSAHGYYYQLNKDKNGKLYLSRSNHPFIISKNDDKTKEEKRVKIIKFTPKNCK